ncbi:hypothetical protein FC92_GL000892 [Liquorilactobacillus hordei DSM 19519]|uniref:Uncharacterized protein n=1 Tax=Liquorilactobacillus hordei DSM 19519 TaxID=1423759 RepID=A0A0R1ME00_9LACO|nr:hypothetical protein FC92_GL000892 [Liquorilactobacillus hordei DSM 19519]
MSREVSVHYKEWYKTLPLPLAQGDLGSGIRINWDITLILVLIIIFLSVFFDKESVLRFFK